MHFHQVSILNLNASVRITEDNIYIIFLIEPDLIIYIFLTFDSNNHKQIFLLVQFKWPMKNFLNIYLSLQSMIISQVVIITNKFQWFIHWILYLLIFFFYWIIIRILFLDDLVRRCFQLLKNFILFTVMNLKIEFKSKCNHCSIFSSFLFYSGIFIF